MGCKKGDFTGGFVIPDLTNYQVDVLRTWNDGSVKHARISGRAALTADVTRTINIAAGTPPTATPLTATDIETAAPTASIQCGAIGTVNLSDLLASPFRTWASGHEMAECHYRAAIGADAQLTANFHVRLFADGRMRVRAFVENAYYNVTAANKSYVPTIIIDGVTVFTFATKNITAITQINLGGNPVEYNEVITSNGHGFLAGQSARITGVGGMTELNDRYIGIASVTANTFTTVAHQGAYSAYTSGGTAAFSHFTATRYYASGWIGGDPEVVALPSHTSLIDAKLAPNYWKRNPSASVLNGLTQNYTPMDNGDITPSMGSAGFQQGLGLLSRCCALYCTSGDVRAYRAVLANSDHFNSYPIIHRDSATGLAPKPSDLGSFSFADFGRTAGALSWKMTHGISEGYLAYLLTGDYWHYETMLLHVGTILLCRNAINGLTELNALLTSETRGTGWNLRSLSFLCALSPDGDAIGAEYQTLLANQMSHWKSVKDGLGGVGLGYLWEYSVTLYGVDGVVAPWQQHFGIMSLGMGSDLEPLEDMSDYIEVRDWLYRAPVGILGDASTYCFTRASNFNLPITIGTSTDPTTWFDTWDQVYDRGVELGSGQGAINDDSGCASNTLGGSSASVPGEAATGYWGNLLPAIAYAVDHGAAGAAAAWARLTGASNFSVLEASADVSGGFNDTPQWGIVPREAEEEESASNRVVMVIR